MSDDGKRIQLDVVREEGIRAACERWMPDATPRERDLFERWIVSGYAAAWDEGYKAGDEDQVDAYWGGSGKATPNPYRCEERKDAG